MPITIHKTIEIKAPAERVWRYVGTEEGLRRWWGINLTLEAKQGGRCVERSLFNGKPLDLTGEVTVYDPPRQLVVLLRLADDTLTWPTHTIIALTLKEQNGCTVVTLEHQALGSLPVDDPVGWSLPQIQTPAPERQVILNRLPGTPTTVAKPTVRPAWFIGAQTWLRAYEMQWDSCLEKLQQIANDM